MDRPDEWPVVFLVRHGRTALNVDGLLRGRLDPALDETGLEEADALGRCLGPTGPSTVVCSPLQRARGTAAAIASVAHVDVVADDRLVDRDYGEWAGTKLDEVIRRYGGIDAAPGVEPMDAFAARIVAGFEDHTSSAGATGPQVIVAHDAVNRCLLGVLADLGGGETELEQPTGCWNRLEHLGSGWTAPVVGALPGDGRAPDGGHDPISL